MLFIQALPEDLDDQIAEASSLGAVTTSPNSTSASINPDVDVDLYRFTVVAGQVVDFDIDTTLNGAGGLGSYLRLFDASGAQLGFNDNAAAPGESTTALMRTCDYTFAAAGTYYIGVSNSANISYDAVTGNGDTSSNTNATGSYQLIVQAVSTSAEDNDDTIAEAVAQGAVTQTTITINGTINPDTM